jgi:citrate lyase subunit beta/citryl-CoA lyase
MELLRSLMFVPAQEPRMVERALGLGEFAPSALDVAILDLEDGVPPDEKDRARAAIAAVLALGSNRAAPSRYVRVNRDLGARDADLAAVLRPGLDGIVAPKIDHADEIADLARDLDEREDAAGMARGSVRVIASVESARGLLDAHAIAACSDRVVALLFGAEDFARDLSLPTEREAEAAELVYARSAIVVAAVAARRQAIDGIWPKVTDLDGLRRDAVQARRLGFAGKSLIHPGQIEVVNDVFSPRSKMVRPKVAGPSRSRGSSWISRSSSVPGERSSCTTPSPRNRERRRWRDRRRWRGSDLSELSHDLTTAARPQLGERVSAR